MVRVKEEPEGWPERAKRLGLPVEPTYGTAIIRCEDEGRIRTMRVRVILELDNEGTMRKLLLRAHPQAAFMGVEWVKDVAQ